jgi:hypothetical protein
MCAPIETDAESDADSVRGKIGVLVVHSMGTSFRFDHERVQSGVENCYLLSGFVRVE